MSKCVTIKFSGTYDQNIDDLFQHDLIVYVCFYNQLTSCVFNVHNVITKQFNGYSTDRYTFYFLGLCISAN